MPLGGVCMWLISEQSKAEPRLKIPFHPRSRPDFHKLPRPVCSDVCGWTPDAASPNSSTHHTDVHLVWSLGSENASLFFYIYYEERQKTPQTSDDYIRKWRYRSKKKNAPVGEYMKKCLSCVQTAPSLTVMRTQKMRNGSFSFFFSFTHESPENTGHTLQYVNPLLVEDKDIHHILVITAVLFCTFTPDELQQLQKSFFFFCPSSWRKFSRFSVQLRSRGGVQTQDPGRKEEMRTLYLQRREREGESESEREREKEAEDRQTDRRAERKLWEVECVAASIFFSSCHHERTLLSLLNKTELIFNICLAFFLSGFLTDRCLLRNGCKCPLINILRFSRHEREKIQTWGKKSQTKVFYFPPFSV